MQFEIAFMRSIGDKIDIYVIYARVDYKLKSSFRISFACGKNLCRHPSAPTLALLFMDYLGKNKNLMHIRRHPWFATRTGPASCGSSNTYSCVRGLVSYHVGLRLWF